MYQHAIYLMTLIITFKKLFYINIKIFKFKMEI